MAKLAGGLRADVDRGPNWLFVKFRLAPGEQIDAKEIAEHLWSVVAQHFTYRLVLELDELDNLPAGMAGQLKLLQERLVEHGGSLKVCGLSRKCEKTWHRSHLHELLPNHANRAHAVLGVRPALAAARGSREPSVT